jgi:glycosyltransferase involved in cell wall biosynthesis
MRARLRQRLAALRRTPRISVVVPIHGTEPYVERCLRSLMEQSMAELEILCVDDASPDRSVVIVRHLAREDARIRLLRHGKNRGLGGARNTGIAAARGTYVTGVDSDDFVRPTMMEQLWRASADGSIDVVACGMAVLDAQGELRFNVNQPEQTINNEVHPIDCLQLLNPSFCNKLWRKELFSENGILFPENQYFEDLATTPRLLHFARHIRVISDPLYCYVQRDGSITNSTSPKHIFDHFRSFDILAEFLKEQGLMEKYSQAFQSMIGKSLHYHSRSIGSSNTSERNSTPNDSDASLRYMLLLKLAYLAHADKISNLESASLQELLLSATTAQDLAHLLPTH